MKIRYQGREEATARSLLAEFLSDKGVDTSKAIVECGDEVYAPGSDLSSVELLDGMDVNVFKVVAGG